MTVIDSDLEIGQDLYSSFIQGIYKGFTTIAYNRLSQIQTYIESNIISVQLL